MKQYKAISGPQTIDVNAHENILEATEKYAKFVNEQAAAGWEYHSASTVIVNKKGGCLRKDSAAKYKMMIFTREGTEGGAPLAENEDHSHISFETANTDNTTDTASHASNKKWIFIVLACLLFVLIGVVVCMSLGFGIPFFQEKEAPSNHKRIIDNTVIISNNYFTYNISIPELSLQESNYAYVQSCAEALNVSVSDYDASRDLYSEKVYLGNKENSLFALTILPINSQYDGNGKQIGEVNLDTKGKNVYGTKPITPGTYAIYITVYEYTEIFDGVTFSIPKILRSISTDYGTIRLEKNIDEILMMLNKTDNTEKDSVANDKTIRDFSEDEIVKAVELRYAGTSWIYELLREDGLLDEQDTVTISQYTNDDEWKEMDSYVEFPSAFGMDSEEKIRSYLLNYYTDRILNNDQFIKSYKKINNSYYFEYNYGMGWPGACAGGEYDIEYLSDDSLIFHSRNWNKDLDSQPGYDVHFYLLLEDGNLKLDKFYFDNDSQIGIY